MQKALSVLIVFTLTILQLLALPASTIKAENTDSNKDDVKAHIITKKELKEELKSKAERAKQKFVESAETVELRKLVDCQKISNTVFEVLNEYSETYPERRDQYNKLVERVNAIVVKLEDAKVDVSVLDEKITLLNQVLQQYNDNMAKGIENLELSVNYVCSNKDKDYTSPIDIAKSSFDKASESSVEVKNIYLLEIRPLLSSLLQELYLNA